MSDTPTPVELLDGRSATVGRSRVTRLLPKRAHRTVGAWCFADRFGPDDVSEAAMAVGPHPHIGLQTVTWLHAGEVLHTDSLGSEQLIRPGELNLMTSGDGIAHAEESPTGAVGALAGIQLWVALPDETRHGPAAFEHHGDLPIVEAAGADVHLLVGEWGGERSPARHDTPLVGLDVHLHGDAELGLDPTFEHVVIPVDGPVVVDGTPVEPGRSGYLATGRASVSLAGTGRVMLLGGQPFGAELQMSWNFVGRTTAELDDAYRDWARALEQGTDRFGDVRSTLARVPAPPR